MKNIIKCTIAVLFIFCESNIFAQDFSAYWNAGIPVFKNLDWEEPNFSVDIGIDKTISEYFFFGAGISYSTANTGPSKNTLTYDRKVFELFSRYGVKLNISGRIKFQPAFRIGYAFTSYHLNEFTSSGKNTNGLSLTPEANITVRISDKLRILSGVSFQKILSKFETGNKLTIPQSYVETKNGIDQFNLKIGLMIDF